MRLRRRQRGSAILEFVLCGIPLMFMWISVVQMCLGMWRYHTLQNAVKATGSYVAVHGAGCATSPNSCTITIGNAATVLRDLAFTIPAASINTTWTACSDGTCSSTSVVTCRLDNCLTNSTTWPPTGFNTAGTSEIKIQADYLFQSALSMVVPGPGVKVIRFNSAHLPGFTHQQVQF